jgi:hypothetical protein
MSDPSKIELYTDEIDCQLDMYERGRVLRTIPSDAWQIIKDTIHSYTEDLDQQVRHIPPGDASVIASQSALYAMNSFEEFFLQDTASAMDFAVHPSPELNQFLTSAHESLDVLKAQGI